MTKQSTIYKTPSWLILLTVSLLCLLPLSVKAVCTVEGWGSSCRIDTCPGVAEGMPCGPAGTTDSNAGRCTSRGASLVCAEPTPAAGSTERETTEPPASRDLVNPLGSDVSVQEIFARIISIFTSISGSLALLMFVYGGALWLTSNGDSNRIEAGKKAMIWAVIGLIVIFGAYALLRALFVTLGGSAIL